MNQPRKFRFECLNAFRGIAILWIVFFHILDDHPGYGIFYSFIRSGQLRLILFFVVSGFGVSNAVHKAIETKASPLSFLKRRLERIYVTYFFALIFTALIIPSIQTVLTSLKGLEYDHFFRFSWIEWFRIATLTQIFYSPSWRLNEAFNPFNGALWFIAVIVQMYIVIALALLTKHYYKTIAAITLFSLVIYIPGALDFFPKGLFIVAWPAFAAGIFAFYLIREGKTVKLPKPVLILVLLALAGTALLFRFNLYLIFAAESIFWLVYPWDKEIAASPVTKFLGAVGVFSYSLYLMHVPLERIVLMLTRNFVPGSKYVVDLLVLIPIIIGLCYLWYLIFEKGVNQKIDEYRRGKNKAIGGIP